MSVGNITGVVRGLLLVGLVAATGACQECERGQYECQGNTARVCVAGEQVGPEHWYERPCEDRFCVADPRAKDAFCALSREPDPVCAATITDRAVGGESCRGNTIVSCYYGYRTLEWQTCRSADSCARAVANQSRTCS